MPPKEVEQAKQLLDEVKALYAEPARDETAKTEQDLQALEQLIPARKP